MKKLELGAGAPAPNRRGNRRLTGQKVSWLWQKPFDILAGRDDRSELLTTMDEVRKYYDDNGGKKE